jgi:hypothetical protein
MRVNEGTCFHSAILSRTGAAKTKVERESYAHVESDAMLVDDLVFQVRVAAGHVMMAACLVCGRRALGGQLPQDARQQTRVVCFISVSSAPHARGIIQQNTLDHGTTCIGAMLSSCISSLDNTVSSCHRCRSHFTTQHSSSSRSKSCTASS